MDRPQVLAGAEQANLRAPWLARLRQTPSVVRPGDPRTLSLERLDGLAKDEARTSRRGDLPAERLGTPFFLRIAALLLVLAAIMIVVVVVVGLVTLPFRG